MIPMKSLIPFVTILIPHLALAGTVKTTDYSTTLGTSVVQCVPADGSRTTLFIESPIGGGTVGYCVGASCTPALTPTAGTSVLSAGSADFWPPGAAPSEALNCIAAAGSTPVTIRSGK